jgi:hypothetical protein
MFRKSALTSALNAWLADGGALTDRLPYSSDSQVCTRGEGKLVCAAIDQARASMERSGDNRSLALDGRLVAHPFASEEGVSQLEQWLTSDDREKASYAVSACAALPFLPASARERLVDPANRHSDAEVRMEAAWACAKSGIGGGIESLVEFARDPRHSKRAICYLEEVGLAGQIPAEARAPDFVAIAEMCNWIAHPSEYGRPPDEIVQVDTRLLYWPPTGDRRQLWVFRYRYDKEDGEAGEGLGMVGSVTWAMFGSNTTDLSPEDVYGLHCAWELIQKKDPAAPPEADVSAGRAILARRNPGFGRAASLQILDGALPGEPL